MPRNRECRKTAVSSNCGPRWDVLFQIQAAQNVIVSMVFNLMLFMKIHSCNVHESGFFVRSTTNTVYIIVLAFMILYVISNYDYIHTGKDKSLMPAQSKLLDALTALIFYWIPEGFVWNQRSSTMLNAQRHWVLVWWKGCSSCSRKFSECSSGVDKMTGEKQRLTSQNTKLSVLSHFYLVEWTSIFRVCLPTANDLLKKSFPGHVHWHVHVSHLFLLCRHIGHQG